ncbi:MAG: hypothetical protein ABIJ36_01260 [Patescibacteria group bacterium]
MRNIPFIKDSIKMDLHRVITATGDIKKPIPLKSVNEFLNHAKNDFDRIKLDNRETKLKEELIQLTKSLENVNDPLSRLRWVEDIMTLRCRI